MSDISPNTTLSHYSIISKLGSGGMGEVYRAIDTRLNREVAIKVLPSEFAKDEDRLQRFEQEAKATSALNQPNILTVYDIGEHNGSPFIVSELLEGGELRDRLNEGPIPIRKVIDYTSQIVSGLSAAHERGIIHRDLKPENLFITKDERVKILDFGIAKLREQKFDPSGSEDATRKAITSPGVVMGTVGYMSPEQVRGHTTDHRSDIFSFGVILYEMITGKRAFQHETMAETMAAILKEEPQEITDSNPTISPSLERITRRCLEKKPEHRFQSTADLRFALEALSSQTSSSREVPAASSAWLQSKKKMPSWSLLIAAVVITGIVVAIALWNILPRQSDAKKRMILNVAPPKQSTLSPVATLASVIALSPDGSAVLVRGSDGLYVRNLDSIDFYKVPATEDAGNQPFWNGPSTLTYLITANNLVSIRLPDGPPEPDKNFHSVGYSRGGSWSDRGTLLLSMFNRLETRGADGKSVVVENTTKREGKLLSPDFIPGSQDFLLYFRENGADNGEVWLATLSGNSMTNVAILLKNETAARYTPAGGGTVLFVRNDNLYAQRLDRSSRALVGEPELVAREVASQPAGSIAKADFSVSRNGVIAWRAGSAGTSQVVVFDRYGKLISTAGPSGDVDTLLVSPKDEKRILAIGDAGNKAFLAEVGQTGPTELGGTIDWLDWTADGDELVGFQGDQVYVRPVDGGQEQVIGRFRYEDTTYFDLSADGRILLINCGLRGSLCTSSLTDNGVFGEPVPITTSKELEFDASFSPDGRSIVYAVRNGGVYVQPFPGPGRRHQISASGFDPVWRRDGKEILFVAESSIMSVSISGTANSLSFAEPQKLFDNLRRSSSSVARSRGLGVSADGSRIYWVQGAEQTEVGLINLMFGFFDN